MSPLPVRSEPAADQCVTDRLEHVAEDNGLLTTQLASAPRWGGGTTRFLAVRPDQRTCHPDDPASSEHDLTYGASSVRQDEAQPA